MTPVAPAFAPATSIACLWGIGCSLLGRGFSRFLADAPLTRPHGRMSLLFAHWSQEKQLLVKRQVEYGRADDRESRIESEKLSRTLSARQVKRVGEGWVIYSGELPVSCFLLSGFFRGFSSSIYCHCCYSAQIVSPVLMHEAYFDTPFAALLPSPQNKLGPSQAARQIDAS